VHHKICPNGDTMGESAVGGRSRSLDSGRDADAVSDCEVSDLRSDLRDDACNSCPSVIGAKGRRGVKVPSRKLTSL
jgi:hypothetical protein